MTTPAPEGKPTDGGTGHRLWGGRFSVPPAPALEELNRSLPVDVRLWREDIQGSRAWVQGLARAGVLTRDEARSLDAGLVRVAGRIEAGAAQDAPDEDIHTLVERLLYEEVGDLAGKLHTGRSRNDQVATDSRLWAMQAGARLQLELAALGQALITQAEATIELVIPSYTHLRKAQPVRVAQWLLAHFWALNRDAQRLTDALARVATLPLGSGAIAGCAFPVDRTLLKELLGFRAVSENSMDAVGDRDWVVELVFVAALLGTHLSRPAEDLIIFSSEEFRFVRLPEAYTTGSSLMPQKRNPDGLELARGKAGRLIGDVVAALTMVKGIPSGYNKDLQEDKELLFGAFDTLFTVLPATRETVAGLEFDVTSLVSAVDDDGLLATDLADELVRRGVPFREAHGAVGRLLRRADEMRVRVADLPDDVWAEAHPAFLAGGRPRPSPEAPVEARALPGGTGRSSVVQQLAAARVALRSREPIV